MSALDNLLAAIQVNSQQAAATKSSLEDIFSKQIGAMNDAATLRSQGTDNQGKTPAQVEAEMRGTMEAQDASVRLRNAAGMTADAGDIMLRLVSENAQRFEEAKALQARIAEKESVDFFDNPLAYLTNQLTLDDDISAYNSTVQQYNLNVDHLNQVNNMIQEGATSYQATKKTVTEESIKSATQASLAMIQADVKLMEARSYATGAEAIKASFDLDTQQLQNASAAFSAYNQTRSLEISQAHLNLAQQEAQRQREKMKDDDSQLVQAYIAGFKAIHGVEPNVKDSKDLRTMALSPKLKDQISRYVDHGIQVMYNLRGSKQLGITPSDAMATVETLRVPLADGPRKVYDRLHKQAQRELQTLRETGGAGGRGGTSQVPKKPEEMQAWIDNRVRTLAAAEAAEIRTGDKSNIYAAPPLKTIAQFKEVSKLPAFKTLLEPMVRSGVEDVTPQQLIELSAKAVQAKKIKAEQAVDLITSYYAAANYLNRATYQYDSLAVPLPSGYNARIELPGYVSPTLLGPGLLGPVISAQKLGAENKVYNLTKPAEVKELLLRHNMSPLVRTVK